jgi:hypothetical protein
MNAEHDSTYATQPASRGGSFLRTMRAVGWSFFGVRRRADFEQDARLNPLHVVIAGLLGAAIFVTVLVLFVKWVVAAGAAA